MTKDEVPYDKYMFWKKKKKKMEKEREKKEWEAISGYEWEPNYLKCTH